MFLGVLILFLEVLVSQCRKLPKCCIFHQNETTKKGGIRQKWDLFAHLWLWDLPLAFQCPQRKSQCTQSIVGKLRCGGEQYQLTSTKLMERPYSEFLSKDLPPRIRISNLHCFGSTNLEPRHKKTPTRTILKMGGQHSSTIWHHSIPKGHVLHYSHGVPVYPLSILIIHLIYIYTYIQI